MYKPKSKLEPGLILRIRTKIRIKFLIFWIIIFEIEFSVPIKHGIGTKIIFKNKNNRKIELMVFHTSQEQLNNCYTSFFKVSRIMHPNFKNITKVCTENL
jgi:hypothetical protein